MRPGMCDYFHLRQPTVIMVDAAGTAPMVTTSATSSPMMIVEASVIADHIRNGILQEAVLHQPVVQRKRWLYVTCGGTFLALKGPLCLGFHFQLDRCIVADLLFGDVCKIVWTKQYKY